MNFEYCRKIGEKRWWLPCLAGLVLVAQFVCGCSEDDGGATFKRVFRSSVDSSPNRGFAWVHHAPGEKFPEGRYDGGYDTQFKGALGVCRAHYKNGVHPGKIFGSRCNIGWGGKEVVVDDFDTLIAHQDTFWHIPVRAHLDLSKALAGGREADGHPLYVCIAHHVTGWAIFKQDHGRHPGKYVAGKCNFGWGGEERAADDFFILAYGAPMYAAGNPAEQPAETCLNGEVSCACKGYRGCTQAGYCQCLKAEPNPATDGGAGSREEADAAAAAPSVPDAAREPPDAAHRTD